MDGDRGLSLLEDPDQWARCAHEGTSLLPDGGVELTWYEDQPPPCGPKPATPSGLAFDRWCRAYRTRPTTGRVEVCTLGSRAGDATAGPGSLRHPLGVAVDRRQRLYIAEAGACTVRVIDLAAGRVLRTVSLGGRRPVDVTADCGRALVLLGDGLLVLDGRRGPVPGPVLTRPQCHGALEPRRIAPGPVVLWGRPGGQATLVADVEGTVLAEVDGATDLDVGPGRLLVVAQAPGLPFRRFRRDPQGWIELEPVGAPGFDGGAVAVAPNGRVAFTTETGIGTTSGSATRRAREGSVTTYRLDSGAYRTRWGRIFLDACLPPGTSIRVGFLTSDEGDVRDPLPRTPPERGARRLRHADESPPMPSATLLGAAPKGTMVFRRPTGSEQPWAPGTGGGSRTYEAPVAAPPGRYLWVELTLTGTGRVSPRVAAIRVERPGHSLLRTLPRSWSRNDADADFLQRFLGPAEGMLHELDERAARRGVLVDPARAPEDLLPWLASFAGLVLDARWPERSRRDLVASAYQLYRLRGTREALVRILALYLGFRPGIVEDWQLRGLGGAVLGTPPPGPPAPAVGGSARTTGTLGRFAVGGSTPARDSYASAAHRFCVLVPGALTTEQRAVVEAILEAHRPAHTCCRLSELGPGMRVGQRLRVALTSYVGPDAAASPVVVGQGSLGAEGVVGHPSVGSRVGTTALTGRVRVG